MSGLIMADKVGPFNPSPEEWERMTETFTTRDGDGTAWPDMSADKIISELLKAKENVELAKWEVLGVTVYAGRTAYAKIRNMFLEDSEMVKVVECAYLRDGECLVAKNEGIAYLSKSAMEMSRYASRFFEPKRPDSSDSSGSG